MIDKLKNKKNGILGVLGFLLILVLMLLFLSLSKSEKEEEQEEATVLVEFEGAEEGASGGSQNSDSQEEQVQENKPVEASQPTPEKMKDQDIEDAPVVDNVKQTTNPTPDANPTDAQETDDKPKLDVPTYTPGSNTSKDIGSGKGPSSDKGHGPGTGKDGKGPGKGGTGNNPEILGGSGRGIIKSPNIDFKTQKKGIVIVEVVINRQGKVISVKGGTTFRVNGKVVENSTLTDIAVVRNAEQDARGSTFSPDPNAPHEQTIYLKYIYNLEKK